MADARDDLQSILGPRYRLAGELARGGMATLYRAHDVRHDRDVAVKVFNPELASVVGVKRFENEIAIASALHHPSIVPLYDSGGGGDVLFYTMPLIEGESLRARLERERQLPLADALQIASEVADALDFAHARGVVHRDIKPENIMLAAGHAMVTDFGIARAITTAAGDRLTSSAIAIGTPAYMAPEQADSAANIDGRADIYALGCVLFEMIAGDPPFTGRTAQAVIARHQAERPPELSVVRSTVPPELDLAVERTLAKAPADRFTTAAELAATLNAIRTGIATGSTRRVAKRPGGVRRAFVGLAITAAIALPAWLFTHRTGSVDTNKVVVFPFAAPGSSAEEGLGEQVSLMVGSALEHTEPLRWLDGQELLGARRSDLALKRGDLTRAARNAAAGYYIDGAVVNAGDSVTVIVKLYDAVADSLVRQESAAGAAASSTAPQLALRAIALILPRLLPPNGTVDLSFIADRNAAAVADWLQGEREYASSQYGAAMDHMRRALEKDSAMGVAALKGTQAAVALEDYLSAQRLVEVALRLSSQLPRHHLALARGLQFYIDGAADSAVAAFMDAQRADTSWSEPWFGLGETYNHLYPASLALDVLAERAFSQAIKLSPEFAPPLIHLAEAAARRGDDARARSLLGAFRAMRPDSNLTWQLDLIVRCATGGPGSINWAAAARRSSESVVNLARILGAGARHPGCSRAALESVLTFDKDTTARHVAIRWSALKGLNYQTVIEGDEAGALALLDSARASGMRAAESLYILDDVAGAPGMRAHADSAMATLDGPVSAMRRGQLPYWSLWSWYHGDRVRLESVALRAGLTADSTRDGRHRLVAVSSAARLALLNGDTAAAIAALRQVRPRGNISLVAWEFFEPASAERLLLAQLLLATGNPRDAIELARQFDSPRSQVDLLYFPASLEVRRAAADLLGLTAERNSAAERLRALRR